MQDLSFFHGHEAWVGEFLKMLPQDRSILRNYVWNAARMTHANAGFHVGMGLTLLTQIVPRYGLWAADGQQFSNLYTLLLAPTGEAKSASVSIGLKEGRAAGINTLVDEAPGSREGFIDSLDDNTRGLNGRPRQALVYSEFADFLNITAAASKGRGGGHAAPLRGAIMNAYDGASMERTLAGNREHGGAETTQEPRGTSKPVVSLIGAANYHVLSAATTQTDWLNGFFGRFLFIHGPRQRHYWRPPPRPAEMDDVVRALQTRLACERARELTQGMYYPPPSMVEPYTDLEPEAYAFLEQWANRAHEKTQHEGSLFVAAAMPRLLPLCYRIALLLSYDFGGAAIPIPGWRLGLEEVQAAAFLVDRHLDAYRIAAAHIVLNDEERPIRDIELVLRKADAAGDLLTEGEISARATRNDRTVSDALRTLMGRGVVRKTQPKEGMQALRYQIVDGFADKVRYLPSATRPSLDLFPTPAVNNVGGGIGGLF